VDQVLDTQARTRDRFGKGPFSTQRIGREALKLYVLPLAAYLQRKKPPRGLEQVLRGLTRRQLAYLALRAILDRIHAGWDLRKRKGKLRNVENPNMLFRLELGRRVRNELEFAGLLASQKWVKAARNRHAALGKFRRIDWTNAECAKAGDWLWDCLAELDCFDEDERGFPKFAEDHKAALDDLAEKLVFAHPLYMPALAEPPAWTAWRVEYDDRISAVFVKTKGDLETEAAIKAAFAVGSIEPHAMGVSSVQRVPLKINTAMLPLLREFAGEEYKRDIVVASALGDKTFWNPVRCDFRGRLIQLCDFNYTRGDPVRSLFLFAEGKRLGDSIEWLEIAVANAHGKKGTWRERHEWVANNRDLIKAVARAPRLIWLQDTDAKGAPKAKEPFLFAAACAEYVAADTNGEEYETHLPVWLDASSNGLQHLALMRGDAKLAAAVNLQTRWVPGGYDIYENDAGEIYSIEDEQFRHFRETVPVQDVYEIVAAHAKSNLYVDGDAQCWLDHDLRDLLKLPIMTLPYGVTKAGMLDQIKEKCDELKISIPSKAMERLRDHIWRAIEKKLPGAMETREYIRGIAKDCLDCKTFMQWVTPSGFPVANRYRKSKLTRVRLPFYGSSLTISDGYLDEPRKKKVLNSAVANVTHSMDSSHLTLSVNSAVKCGITNVMVIHDCFGAMAPDVRSFAEIRRHELAKMYHGYNPLTQLGGSPPPPDPDFEIMAVSISEYFDR
jgi:DNA-directed RNA polymerase